MFLQSIAVTLDSVQKVLLLTCFNISRSQFPCGTEVDPDEFTLASEKDDFTYKQHMSKKIEIMTERCLCEHLRPKKTLL